MILEEAKYDNDNDNAHNSVDEEQYLYFIKSVISTRDASYINDNYSVKKRNYFIIIK